MKGGTIVYGANFARLVSNVSMYETPYALWSIWPQLSYLYRGLILILGAIVTYALFSGIRSILRLSSTWKRPNVDADVVRQSVASAFRSRANVQRAIGATFYLFGLVLFLGLQTVGQWIGDGKMTMDVFVLRNFILHAAFAANVFLIFLVLHFIQWGIAAVLDSLSERMNKQLN
jgi:hypothetical protein